MLLKLQQMYVYVNYSSLLCPLELCFHDFLKKTLVTSTFIPEIYLTSFDSDEEFKGEPYKMWYMINVDVTFYNVKFVKG